VSGKEKGKGTRVSGRKQEIKYQGEWGLSGFFLQKRMMRVLRPTKANEQRARMGQRWGATQARTTHTITLTTTNSDTNKQEKHHHSHKLQTTTTITNTKKYSNKPDIPENNENKKKTPLTTTTEHPQQDERTTEQ
jgi:hypothetical protein